MSDATVVLAVRTDSIAEDEFQRVEGRAEVGVDTEDARGVLVVVLERVTRDVLAPDNAFAVGPVASKGYGGDGIANRNNQLVIVEEAKDHIVQALIIGHVDHR